ncbi:MAG: hypothetical protein RL177_109 [Bacteroidota bacterium]|jgi:TonB-linked SusC/RagA family outer membrane protein
MDGRYTINIRSNTAVLIFTSVGFKTQTISTGDRTVVDVAMVSDVSVLDELVVSGYGVTPKRELTGSISSVKASEIGDVPLQNAESFLQGRAAGVNITTNSGNPGGAFRVQVRGVGSINAASEPLYIVDGVQISFSNLSGQTSMSPLNQINPNDIESIEVLKDAASAAIYGAQGAAGVVIITTKRGRQGDTQITAKVERGVRESSLDVNYINTEQYLEYLAEGYVYFAGGTLDAARANRKAALLASYGSPNGDGELANTNWADYIFGTGLSTNYTISASGGDAKTRFLMSAGYENTEGHILDDQFQRISVRANIDHQANSRLSQSLSVNLAKTFQFGICQDGTFINCPTAQAFLEPSFTFPYKPDGTYNNLTRFGTSGHPLVTANEVDRNTDYYNILLSSRTNYTVNDWMILTGTLSTDLRFLKDERFDNRIANPTRGGFLNIVNREVQNYQASLVASTTHNFGGKNNIATISGVEYRRDFNESVLVTADGFPGTFFGVLNAAATPTAAGGTYSEFRFGSYFTNIKYNYAEKYFLALVARVDGSSRFGADKAWGLFPSISGAWRISEENFFPVDAFDELKLRAGYGTSGNSNIGNFASIGLYSVAGSYNNATGLAPAQLANPLLSWESANELNVGLDYSLFEGRISGSIDAYSKENENLLFSRPLPSDSGFGSITENIGSVKNEGLEFEVQTVNLNRGGLVWRSRFNVGFTRNEITKLPNDNTIGPQSNFNKLEVGKPIGIIQVAKWAGVNPADGRPMWYDINGNITYTPTVNDLREYKDGVADAVGGFGNSISWKGLSVDAFLQFSFGQWAFPSSEYYFSRVANQQTAMTDIVLDRWQQPGDITYYPRAYITTTHVNTADYRTQLGTHSIFNASYIRLKNITVSYDVPTRLVERVGLKGVRFYSTAVNLITWTAWPYYDPEVAANATDIYSNVTAASYPTARQINGGIEIRF